LLKFSPNVNECMPLVEGTSFYWNSNLDAEWRAVRKASKAWRQRDRRLVELVHANSSEGEMKQAWDLDPNGRPCLTPG